jgi:iron only hydrogenase large subunit-like protein
LSRLDFTELRGLEGIRSATIDFDGLPINIGIAHGLGNARKLLEDVRAGKSNFHAIEIMACPGGCIGGGGQPYHHGNVDILKKRRLPLPRRCQQAHPQIARKPIHRETVRRVLGRAMRSQIARAAAHALLQQKTETRN